jgi:GNAT superfamily N-acetyltransferase
MAATLAGRQSMLAATLLSTGALAWSPAAVHRPDWALGRPARAAVSVAPVRAGAVRMIEEIDQGTDFYKDRLCDEEEECALPEADEFTVAILGDLHMDPRKLEDYDEGRAHILPVLQDAQKRGVGVALVSLGDLGESKACEPPSPELFAGTSRCHQMAADYFNSFGVPYEVVGGNHDLEGIDEFDTDKANLEAFCRIHGKPTPHFVRQVADKTLLVGLTSTIFRKARYTSHEVSIDDEQLRWFADFVASKPADEGWRLFVFTHAPPMGSGLRVLQENHVVNGCCWLNHSGGQNADPRTTRKFIELVRQHRCAAQPQQENTNKRTPTNRKHSPRSPIRK